MTTRRWWWRISLSPPSQIGHFLIIPPLADPVDQELRFLPMIQGGSIRVADPASSISGKRCRRSGPQRVITLRSAQVIQLVCLNIQLCAVQAPAKTDRPHVPNINSQLQFSPRPDILLATTDYSQTPVVCPGLSTTSKSSLGFTEDN